MRRLLLALLVTVAAVVGSACATGGPQPPIFPSGSARAVLQVDAGDNGRTIGVADGSTFILTLPVENPDWRFTTEPDSSVVSLVTRRRTGDVERWIFHANGSGTTDFELSSGAPEPFSLIVSVT